MEIDKKDFNKLNQLDRIEYRQRYNQIKPYYDTLPFYSTTHYGLTVLVGFILILVIVPLELNTKYNLGRLGFKVLATLFIFDLVYFFINIHLEKKKISKLESEYFKIELKKE